MLISCGHKRDLMDLEFHTFLFCLALDIRYVHDGKCQACRLKKAACRTQNHRMEGVFEKDGSFWGKLSNPASKRGPLWYSISRNMSLSLDWRNLTCEICERWCHWWIQCNGWQIVWQIEYGRTFLNLDFSRVFFSAMCIGPGFPPPNHFPIWSVVT